MKRCKFERCYKPHHCKGWCKKHYGDLYHGRMDENGIYSATYKPVVKGRKCRYQNCNTIGSNKNSLRNGLCNKHRKWVEKGYIDKETLELLPGQELPKEQGLYTHCKVSGCVKKHKAKGFCQGHYKSFKIYKTIDDKGKRFWDAQKKTNYSHYNRCSVRTCECRIDGTERKKRLVKGFCQYHYQLFRKGYFNEFGMQIKEIDFLTREERVKETIKRWRKNAKQKSIKITWDEETKTIKQWSKITKIKVGTIKSRYKANMPVELIFIKGNVRKSPLYKEWKNE